MTFTHGHAGRAACTLVVVALLLLLLGAASVATAQTAAETPVAAAAAEAAAAPSGGLTMSPFWLGLLMVSVALWMYATSWVSVDARGISLDFARMSSFIFIAGAIGVVLAVFVHAAMSLLMIALVATAVYLYIAHRNKHVPEHFKLFGPYHRAHLAQKIPFVRDHVGVTMRHEAETAARRAAVPLTNARGLSLDDLVGDHPTMADGAGVLMDLIVRAGAVGARKASLLPAQGQYVVQFLLDGVLNNVEGVEETLGQQVLACAADFSGLSSGGKMRLGTAVFHAQLPGKGAAEVQAAISAVSGKPALTLEFPDWTADLYKNGLEALGMHEAVIKRVRSVLDQGKGGLILCGLPASGRTTTLYAVADQIDILTTDVAMLEREPKSQLQDVRHWRIPDDVPFVTFFEEIMREGPDALVLERIEDADQARTLMTFAAEYGLALTTFLSPDAPEALLTLARLCGGADLVNRGVACVVVQQLVRRLCTECREPVDPPLDLLKKLGLTPEQAGTWYRSVGCPSCIGSGYLGRTALFGMLIMTEEIKTALRHPGASRQAILNAAGKAAFRTMYQDGVTKVTAGITTLDELRRVLQRKGTAAPRPAKTDE